MRVAILCVAATAFVASTAVAGDNPEAKKVIDPGSKIVCKAEDVVGSKIPKRICLTRQQWDQMKDNAREALEKRSLWQGEKSIPGN